MGARRGGGPGRAVGPRGGGVWPSGPAVVRGAARLAERRCRDSYFHSPVAVTQFSCMLPGPVINKLHLFHALATIGK